MASDRDWMDYVSTLLLPAVLAIGGIAYTAHKDRLDEQREQAERVEDEARLALDRDSGYVRLLASTNDKERDLGIKIIDALSKEHKFSVDLVPVVAAVAGGRPSDPATQTAVRILQANPDKVSTAQLAPASNGRTQVYIQIAKEEQRAEAQALAAELRRDGFATPGIELVSAPTVNTYVRFFARKNARVADQVDAAMHKLGFASAVQDFTASSTTTLSQIEVWIGSRQAPIPAPS